MSLVLSRKKEESIIIGDRITITVIEIRGDKVRLAIVAPSDVSVHRQEVWEAIKRENEREKGKKESQAVQQPVDPAEMK